MGWLLRLGRRPFGLPRRRCACPPRPGGLRFTHDRVSTMEHWSDGDGTVVGNNAFWRRVEGRKWMPAKKIYSMPMEGGENVIYCLEEQNSRGDMLE